MVSSYVGGIKAEGEKTITYYVCSSGMIACTNFDLAVAVVVVVCLFMFLLL